MRTWLMFRFISNDYYQYHFLILSSNQQKKIVNLSQYQKYIQFRAHLKIIQVFLIISSFRPKQQSLRQRSLEQYRSSREAVTNSSTSSREAVTNSSSSSREAAITSSSDNSSSSRDAPYTSSSLQSLHKYQVILSCQRI